MTVSVESDMVAELEAPDTSYYPVAAISCWAFLLGYKYVSPVISDMYFPSYKSLPANKQIEWHTRVNSSIHAVLVSIMCLYALLYDEEIHKDPVWADSHQVKSTCAILVGYVIADTVIMLKHYKAVGEIFYIFHHGATVYAYYYVMTYGTLCWFANFRVIAEFSTPFVNQRWFLDALGYPKSSFTFVANGVAMALMFLMVRILVIPPYWYKVYSIYGTASAARLGNIWYVLISTCLVLDTINAYWFYKIFHGAKKIIHQTMRQPPKKMQ